MFCASCQSVKAESGCYLSGVENRVCLTCYQSTAGLMPLPANTPPALGGAFADGGKIAEYKQKAKANVQEKMNRVSETVAAGAAGIGETWDRARGEVREKREAFWREMPTEVQEYRNKLNNKRDEIRGEVREKVNEVKETIAEQISRFNPLDLL